MKYIYLSLILFISILISGDKLSASCASPYEYIGIEFVSATSDGVADPAFGDDYKTAYSTYITKSTEQNVELVIHFDSSGNNSLEETYE